jgi:hypothetical protein
MIITAISPPAAQTEEDITHYWVDDIPYERQVFINWLRKQPATLVVRCGNSTGSELFIIDAYKPYLITGDRRVNPHNLMTIPRR